MSNIAATGIFDPFTLEYAGWVFSLFNIPGQMTFSLFNIPGQITFSLFNIPGQITFSLFNIPGQISYVLVSYGRLVFTRNRL